MNLSIITHQTGISTIVNLNCILKFKHFANETPVLFLFGTALLYTTSSSTTHTCCSTLNYKIRTIGGVKRFRALSEISRIKNPAHQTAAI